MEDMEDNVLIAICRNCFINDNQLSYCRVRITNENIDEINKVSMFFNRRRIGTNLGALIGREIYLILGGGVRVIRDRENVNTNWFETDWNMLLHNIGTLSYEKN